MIEFSVNICVDHIFSGLCLFTSALSRLKIRVDALETVRASAVVPEETYPKIKV